MKRLFGAVLIASMLITAGLFLVLAPTAFLGAVSKPASGVNRVPTATELERAQEIWKARKLEK